VRDVPFLQRGGRRTPTPIPPLKGEGGTGVAFYVLTFIVSVRYCRITPASIVAPQRPM
jgi:hypothetical protein